MNVNEGKDFLFYMYSLFSLKMIVYISEHLSFSTLKKSIDESSLLYLWKFCSQIKYNVCLRVSCVLWKSSSIHFALNIYLMFRCAYTHVYTGFILHKHKKENRKWDLEWSKRDEINYIKSLSNLIKSLRLL